MSHTADLGSFVAQQEGDLSPGAPLEQSDHDSSATVAGAIEEQRTAERRPPSEVAADIRFGIRVVADARPIDISQTGILSETTTRLRPGSAVELVLHIDGEQHMLRATVVRSSVYSLNPTVFRTAFNFDQPTTLSEPE